MRRFKVLIPFEHEGLFLETGTTFHCKESFLINLTIPEACIKEINALKPTLNFIPDDHGRPNQEFVKLVDECGATYPCAHGRDSFGPCEDCANLETVIQEEPICCKSDVAHLPSFKISQAAGMIAEERRHLGRAPDEYYFSPGEQAIMDFLDENAKS